MREQAPKQDATNEGNQETRKQNNRKLLRRKYGTATSSPDDLTPSPTIINVMLWMKKEAYEDATIILKSLDDFPSVAILFKRKIGEYSKARTNFLTASYGGKSVWKIPSFWKWNIREFNLYRRTLDILRTQLARGRTTKVLLPSGIPIPRVLEYETVVRAALEDGTAWECPHCKARNLSQNKNCVICGTSQT